MKMITLIGAGLLGALVAGNTAYAQPATTYFNPKAEYGNQIFQFAGAGIGEGRLIEGLGGPVVKGKPFSAIEERHSLQTLGDGTRIESSETNHLYRDELGRTRIERNGGNITISDPVAGFQVELNPKTKVATKMVVFNRYVATTGPGLAAGEAKVTELRAQLSRAQTNFTEQSPQVAELRAKVGDAERSLNAGQAPAEIKNLTAAYSVDYAARLDPPQADNLKRVAETQPAIQRFTISTGTHLDVLDGNNASVESLPSQMVNGILSQGTRTTETIPVGKIGNDRAISVVNERWYSGDLQMLVKSTSSDPRFGETTYQLNSVVQASPDPSLFQIPADYTIRK